MVITGIKRVVDEEVGKKLLCYKQGEEYFEEYLERYGDGTWRSFGKERVAKSYYEDFPHNLGI